MGRKVNIRVNYRQDAVFLSRLSEAIQKDDKRSVEWRNQAIGYLNALGMMFLEDANKPAPENTDTKEVGASEDNR